MKHSEIFVKKDGEPIRLTFKAAERGAKVELDDKTKVSINGHWISDDGTASIPELTSMSDFRWQWLVFIDKLFHPEKYEKNLGEDVQQGIEHLTQWLVNAAPEEVRAKVSQDLEELKAYIKNLDEEMKPAAEIALREWVKAH